MTPAEDILESRTREWQIYSGAMNQLYSSSIRDIGNLFDEAAHLTDWYCNISGDAILRNSQIIRVLRYCVAPSISQMKLGQLFGIRSTDKFENSSVAPGTRRFDELAMIAGGLAEHASEHLDRSRFIWLDEALSQDQREYAYEFAKRWTCSIVSDQSAQTSYRNWRKSTQEDEVAKHIEASGYNLSGPIGMIRRQDDLRPGEYTKEVKIQGRTRQKADLAIRSARNNRLILIEAKAVGVEIDSAKRIKECCDKSSDWRSAEALGNPVVVAVIAGFFNPTGIQNLQASNISVVWEHRLSDLEEVL